MIINDLYNNKKQDVEEGRFVKGPGGVPLDRQGRPVAPKAEPMRMRQWVVHHEGQRGEGGTEVIEAPNLETAWELANEYDLDIIDIKPVKGVAEGLPQTLRKVVPGYAKREIDQKMDAEKFGRTDVDRDANFHRYKKIQDKIKNKGVAEDNAGMPVHRIGLTVTDPNHPMVSKRGETIQKTVRVPGADREKAINSAIAHYRRKGYKVHDHHYIGTVDQGVAESMSDDMAAMAQKKFPNAYISKNGQEVQKPENWGKPYTPPAAASADLEKQQRELTAKYPNIDELVRKAELNRDPNYEMADGQAYYAARDAEQNYQKLRQIQRVIQGLNESLDRSHLP